MELADSEVRTRSVLANEEVAPLRAELHTELQKRDQEIADLRQTMQEAQQPPLPTEQVIVPYPQVAANTRLVGELKAKFDFFERKSENEAKRLQSLNPVVPQVGPAQSSGPGAHLTTLPRAPQWVEGNPLSFAGAVSCLAGQNNGQDAQSGTFPRMM